MMKPVRERGVRPNVVRGVASRLLDASGKKGPYNEISVLTA